MRQSFVLLFLLISSFVNGQTVFDSLKIERSLMTLPNLSNEMVSEIRSRHPQKFDKFQKTVETVDKYFRQIADSLYNYRSLKHTIIESALIELPDSLQINPLVFGDRITLSNILFYNYNLDFKLDSISRSLKRSDRKKLYKFLSANFDEFSKTTNKLNAKAIRLRYIKFPDGYVVQVGIDVYGSHFLWTIDSKEWTVTKVEKLWVY